MTGQTPASPPLPDQESNCLARSVRTVLAEEPALEAVTFNRLRKTISVATLGRADVPKITERVVASLQSSRDPAAQHCGLLDGGRDCQDCSHPLTPEELRAITIKNEGGVTTIARMTCPTAPRFWRWRDIPWPKVALRDVEFSEAHDHADEWKAQLVAAVLCGVFGLAAFGLKGTSLELPAFVLAYLAGGWFTAGEVWESLQEREVDVHFLMLAVALGSACIGAWGEGATLLFLFSLSGALEHYALGRSQREISALFKAAPKVATVLDASGAESEVPVERLKAGMRLLVKPGAQFPVDAEIARGRTAADESNLTGESVPVEKTTGDTTLAGTMNLWGAVEVVVSRPARESALSKIIQLIKEAQSQKAPSQLFTDKFGTVYTYSVLTLSFAMFFVWWLGAGLAPFHAAGRDQSAFYHAMTLLVVASPCALVLSIPSAVLAAIAWGARHGILFRGGAAVEKLAGINVVALDKTGTLTTGELRVERVESFPAGREDEILALAYSLERLSNHPLARAISRHARQREVQPLELEQFESVTGCGLQASPGGKTCLVGKKEWLVQNGVALEKTGGESNSQKNPDAGLSEVWVALKGELLGRIVLRDDIRPQAAEVVQELRQEGLRVVVLTGDHRQAGDFLKQELKLDDVRAGLTPRQKLTAIKELGDGNQRVAMVGDGVNDAPSLAAADVGVAMGARGADAALEQAEVVLMHDRLENFLTAFRLSQRARHIIRQNLVISLGTVIVLVCSAMLRKIPLTLGVVGHEGSTVVVVMNSLRLLFGRVNKE